METAATLRGKLHELIDTMDDEKVEAIYSIFEGQLIEQRKWWEDDEFVAELEQRVKDVESGKDKGFTWEEVKKNARLSRQAK